MYRWVLDVGITVKFHENLLNGFMLDIRFSGLCDDNIQTIPEILELIYSYRLDFK